MASPRPWRIEECDGCGALVLVDANGEDVLDVHWIYDLAAARVVDAEDARLIVEAVNAV